MAAATLAAIVARAWRAGRFWGGVDHLSQADVAFPILVLCAAGLSAFAAWSAGSPATRNGPTEGGDGRQASTAAGRARRALGRRDPIVATAVLLAGLPLAQAFGTGNPIMWLAGVMSVPWAVLVVGLALRAVAKGGAAQLAAPAGVLVAATSLGCLSIGMGGLWLHPFLLNVDLREQTVPVRGVEALRGVTVDTDIALLLERAATAVREEGATDRPGFTTFNSTGSPSRWGCGIRRRRSSCRSACPRSWRAASARPAGPATSPRERPWWSCRRAREAPVQSSRALQACGIDFPATFRSRTITAGRTSPDVQGSITLWFSPSIGAAPKAAEAERLP